MLQLPSPSSAFSASAEFATTIAAVDAAAFFAAAAAEVASRVAEVADCAASILALAVVAFAIIVGATVVSDAGIVAVAEG
jgi:hypothetical protein